MIIQKLVSTRYFSRMESFSPVVGNTDRLVFVVKRNNNMFSYMVFDFNGNLSLHDKILAFLGTYGGFNLPEGHIVEGPFYVGGLKEAEVRFPEWDSTKEFVEIMDYEFLRRKPFSVKMDVDGVIEELEGRSLDWEEFKHLYVRDHPGYLLSVE